MSNYIYSEVTKYIRITVKPNFLEKLSCPEHSKFIWSYSIVLENMGTKTIQLINRYWQIIDKFGHIENVEGPGVVGKQPIIKPGESFEYSSHTELSTSSGIMFGSYDLIYANSNEQFSAKIPVFSLDMPNEVKVIH